MQRDNGVGCGCKPLKVDKMSVKEMKSELFAHGGIIGMTDRSSIEGMSKGDLVIKLKELAKVKSYCDPEHCSCAKNGIACHDDACDCGSKCSNLLGKICFDSSIVKKHRLLFASAKQEKSLPPGNNKATRPPRSMSM